MTIFDSIGSGITKIGKKAVGAVEKIGKKAVSGVRKVGKKVSTVAQGVKKGLDFGIKAVEDVASRIEDAPVIGLLARDALESPLGQQFVSVFKGVKDVSLILGDFIEIADKSDKLLNAVENASVEDFKDPKKREQFVKASISLGKDIKNSEIGKQAGKAKNIPAVDKSIKKFNKSQKELVNKVPAKYRKEIKKQIKKGLN